MNEPDPPFILRRGYSPEKERSRGRENENENPCESVWKNGQRFHLDEFNIDHAISVPGGHQCRVMTDDNRVFTLNLDDMKKEEFVESIKIIDAIPFKSGIYTWIIYSNDEKHMEFAACETRSSLEIGSKHIIIAYKSGATRIHAAGEIKIDGSHKFYNFMSGTYMRELLNTTSLQGKRKRRCDSNTLNDYLRDKINDYLGDTFKYVDKTLISISMKAPMVELENYTRFGAKYTLFDKKDDCYTYKNSSGGARTTYKFPRRFSRAYCKKTPCKKMGFTQRASCRPYKNCYKGGTRRH